MQFNKCLLSLIQFQFKKLAVFITVHIFVRDHLFKKVSVYISVGESY